MPPASLPDRLETSQTRPAVLLVAHGSRDGRVGAALAEQCRLVAGELAERGVDAVVDGGFLGLAQPTAQAAAARLRSTGVRELAVVPMLLTDAFHAREDVPELVATLRSAGTVQLADPLGEHPIVLRDVYDRLSASGGLDGLVIGVTGTSDVEAESAQIATIRRCVGDLVPPERLRVVTLTTAGTTPRAAAGELLAAGVTGGGWFSWSLLPGTLATAGLAAAREVLPDLADLGRIGPSAAVAHALADRALAALAP